MDNSLKNTRFYFIVSGVTYEIAEPIGFDSAQFILEQEEGRYGRDIFFSQNDFEFSPTVEIKGLTHRFELLAAQYKSKGFEADVKLAIDVDGVRYVLGQLDFPNCDTDLYQYFKCKVIQDTHQAVIKRNMDKKVDLYAPAVDFEVEPIVKEQIILEPISLFQISKWMNTGDPLILDENLIAPLWNITPVIDRYEIEDTLSPQYGFSGGIEPIEEFIFLESQTGLSNITFQISNGKWDVDFNMGQDFFFLLRKGETFDDTFAVLPTDIVIDLPVHADGYDTGEVEIFDIAQGEKLWGWFWAQGGITGDRGVRAYTAEITMKSISKSIPSVVNGIRLIDAVENVVKRISGKNTISPILNSIEFIDQFIFNGNELRGISEKFIMSFKKILEWLPECNLDYEILENGDIFIGHESEFYTDHLIKSFPAPVLKGYKSYFNEKFQANRINYKYSEFEQGKNALQKDSLQGVSTEFEMNFPNKMVENTKEIEVDFIRDAFLLEKTRRDSILVTERASTEDDEDIFILDAFYDESGFPQEIIAVLRHRTYDDPFPGVELINDGSFNWLLLGIEQFDIIQIIGNNTGVFITVSIEPNIIRLQQTMGNPPDFNGVAITRLLYLPDNLFYKNRLGEGFTYQEGLTDYISNLRFAPKRNLLKYWSEYLRTSLEYNSNKTIKNSYYRNGGDVVANFILDVPYTQGRQDRDIDTNLFASQLLTPEIVECDVLCEFADFMDIQSKVRGSIPNQRGYIEVERTDGTMVKLHPKKLMYDWNELKLSITGEVRKN